jgi:glycosyltransferase involved in cell wall biosynthesis
VREKLCEHDSNLRSRITVIPWAGFLDRELKGTSLHKGGESGTQPDRPYNSLVEAYLAKKRPFFLCVANFEKRKNHKILFEAMRDLLHVDLVLVGNKGWGWQEVERQRQELCQQNPCFWFQNLAAHDLVRLYEKSLALVLPSLDEGFGLPVCEGIQFQKPLILSQINTFYEIAGNAAIYFDPQEGVEDLRRALTALAEDSQTRASWAAKTLSRQHLFSWELTAREHLKMYRKFMGMVHKNP